MATEQLAEQAAEGIDEVAVGVEKVADATRHLTGRDVGIFSSGALVGISVGFAVGFYIADHRLKTKYSKLAATEIHRIREHYIAKDRARQNQEKPPIQEYEPPERPTRPPVPVAEPVRRTVFEESVEEAEWDYQEEMASRNPDEPYVVHYDEYQENPNGHDQHTYTFYESDDTMVNSRDQIIEEDLDATFGLGNLQRWGHGSNDSNIVYIRNDRLELDFEIIRDRGSYSDVVNSAIRHSASRERPKSKKSKRRFDDERD